MRQFILTILVLCNIGAGFEVATDLDDVWAGIDSFNSADEVHSGLIGNADQSAEEAGCDHCCHAAAHFVGAIVSCLATPYVRTASDFVFTHTPYQFAGRSPPTPPPNA